MHSSNDLRGPDALCVTYKFLSRLFFPRLAKSFQIYVPMFGSNVGKQLSGQGHFISNHTKLAAHYSHGESTLALCHHMAIYFCINTCIPHHQLFVLGRRRSPFNQSTFMQMYRTLFIHTEPACVHRSMGCSSSPTIAVLPMSKQEKSIITSSPPPVRHGRRGGIPRSTTRRHPWCWRPTGSAFRGSL